MDRTPSSNRVLRTRHIPTPKFSERKKKLFDETDELAATPKRSSARPSVIREYDEDSDLGPISPLEFSSSPSNFNRHNDIANTSQTNQRTNFTNILDEISLKQKYSLKRLTVNLGQKVCIDSDVDDAPKINFTTDIDSEDGVAPLCASMKKMANVTDPPTPITAASVFCNTENYAAKQMKTPSESTITIASADQLIRGHSFRKSLLSNVEFTPNDAESTVQLSKHDKGASVDRPKAKTSLIFTETAISTKSFYGSSSSAKNTMLHRFGSGTISAIVESKLPMMSIISKFKKQTSTHRKQSSHKRSKWNGPRLWQNTGIHKTMRFKRRSKPIKHSQNSHKGTKAASSTSIDSIDHSSRRSAKKINHRIKGSQAASLDAKKRYQTILKDQNSAQIPIPSTGSTSDADSEYEDDDDDDPLLKGIGISREPAKDAENDVPTHRKFFKSKANTTTKKYHIMRGFSATMKRGNDFKLELPAKRVRRSRVSHKQINNIIAQLLSPKKSNSASHLNSENSLVKQTSESNNPNPPNQMTESESLNVVPQTLASQVFVDSLMPMENTYRQMIPYNTIDPSKISQQEAIIELLISNGICNDETFKVFIAEPDLHKERASAILDDLYCVSKCILDDDNDGISICEWRPDATDLIFSSDTPPTVNSYNANVAANDVGQTTDVPMSPATQISTMTSTLVLDCASEQPPANIEDDSSSKLFPIFRKNFHVSSPIRDLYTHLALSATTTTSVENKWKPIGNEQYQIDAGQKEFGMRQCAQCEMTYSVHEPEDELLHLKYHNSFDVFAFKGWADERLVCEIAEWGIGGRIIFVCETDSKAKKNRVKNLLSMVDRDLGFSMRELVPKTLIYLGIARNRIVGVLVAQPLQQAQRYVYKDGLDCCSTATYPAKCGISRIWVAPNCRRFGIASKMVTTLRGHFIFGSFLSFDDIAFSSPTENGKKLATQITGRSDFLIYER